MLRKYALSITLLFLLFGLAGCPSNKIVFPPLNDRAAQIQTPGKFVWYDLYSTDMTACENFYEGLFGWDFRRTNENVAGVKTIFLESKPIGNMIGRESENGDSQWLPYMSVRDVDSALEVVVAKGGSIHRASSDMPDRGRVGIVLDPQGAPFAVITSSAGDPQDGAPKANHWLGSELWTTDVQAAEAFYRALAGYDVQVVNVHEKAEYRLLFMNGKRRGGIVHFPSKKAVPEWIPFIGVDKVLAIVTKVDALGGKVIIPPRMDIKEGRIAVIADPSGAVFGLQQIK